MIENDCLAGVRKIGGQGNDGSNVGYDRQVIRMIETTDCKSVAYQTLAHRLVATTK